MRFRSRLKTKSLSHAITGQRSIWTGSCSGFRVTGSKFHGVSPWTVDGKASVRFTRNRNIRCTVMAVTLPMMTDQGPFGSVGMDGMFSVVKVRDGRPEARRLQRPRALPAPGGHTGQ